MWENANSTCSRIDLLTFNLLLDTEAWTCQGSSEINRRPAKSDKAVVAVQEAIDNRMGKIAVAGLARKIDMARKTRDRLVQEDLGHFPL